MASHFLDLVWVQRMGSHCYYFVTMLVLESVVIVVVVVVVVIVVVVFMADENSGPTYNHHGQMGNRDFLISVATNKLRFALVLRMNNNRVYISVANE